ncbi:pentatricopeptide repeat-containing protein 2, mitochondrial [Megalopta genalis]|uniref:pentatricopeptide repeat-containing protein 2, mitochondrial n=1 Tax=Megalopta genalis TaxID=115081 RepID=UPI003FD6B00A
MALSIRGFIRLNFSRVNNVYSTNNLLNVGVRHLFTNSALGIVSFENTRNIYRNQFQSIEATFRSKMKDICESPKEVVFTEDLKAMLHLIQKNESDLELINKMIEKYECSNKEIKFGSYVFGPVVMRMYYYLNEPTAAMDTFYKLDQTPFFKQSTSMHILFSLLYKNDMFVELQQVYEHLMHIEDWYNSIKHCIITLTAACYKANTPESFEFALKVWRQSQDKDFHPPNRATAILAALALKQSAPELGLELVANINKAQYINTRCIKIMAYMHLNKYVQIIPIFKTTLNQDVSSYKQTYYADVITKLESNVKDMQDEGIQELLHLIGLLYKHEHITTNTTLEENLLKPRNYIFRLRESVNQDTTAGDFTPRIPSHRIDNRNRSRYNNRS